MHGLLLRFSFFLYCGFVLGSPAIVAQEGQDADSNQSDSSQGAPKEQVSGDEDEEVEEVGEIDGELPEADENISVTGKKIQRLDAQEATKIEISREEAELVAPSGDVAQVPKLFPGTLSRPFESEVAVRGSNTDNSLYFVDDLQTPNFFEPISGTSVVPARAIKSLSFYPGNFDAEYGNANGGVIKLETRDDDIWEPYSEFRLNTPIYFSAYHETDVGEDASMIVSFRKSTLEYYIKMIPEDTLDGNVLLPYFQDAYLQYFQREDDYEYKIRYIHSRSGAEVKVYTERALDQEGYVRFNFERGYDLIGIDWEKDFGATNLEIDPFFSQSNTLLTVSNILIDTDVQSITLPIRSQTEINPNLNLFTGISSSISYYNLDLVVPDDRRNGIFADPENTRRLTINVNETGYHHAAWAAVQVDRGKLSVVPGIRVFGQSNINKASYDPRLTVKHKSTEFHTLKAGVGQYSSSPNVRELSPDYGNEDLDWVRTMHYMIGVESYVLDNWTSDFQFFYKRWANDVTTDPEKRFVNGVQRYSRGFEWFMRYNNFGNVFGWLSYTYSQTKEKRPSLERTVTSDNDVTHILHLVGNYKLSDTFQVGSRFKLQSGYPYTPVDEVWYQANSDSYLPVEDKALTNTGRTPMTKSFSLFAQKKWKRATWDLIMRFGFEEYQFNKSSPNISYNYDYSESEYTTGLPVIPFIELRAIL